jgi:hypothetical protein
MRNVALLSIAVALAGCAGTRQERAAEFQRELPQLVAACNSLLAQTDRLARRDAFDACRRLSMRNRLELADPATVSAFVRSAGQTSSGQSTVHSAPYAIPMPLPQVQ